MKYVLQQDLFSKGNVIQSKINNKIISNLNIIAIHDIDKSIIICTLKAEQSLRTTQTSHLWYPTLDSTILQIHLWHCVRTKLKKPINRRLKIINANLQKAHKHLKYIRLKAHELRHDYLTQCKRET